MDEIDQGQPECWNSSRLKRASDAPSYNGWVLDLGDGTCRYANEPLLGADFGITRLDYNDPDSRLLTKEECDEINAKAPHYGDRVRMKNGRPDPTQIIERFEPLPL